MIAIIFGCLVAYFLGSIPTAVWYSRFFHGIDIRKHGSGNAGATNSLRVLGKKAGIVVLLIDCLKGFVAGSLANFFIDYSDLQSLSILKSLFGFFAVLGHIFPVFVEFRGGKGVATALGVIMAIHPLATLVCMVIFLLIVILTKYVSLGSMLSALGFPIQLALGLWGNQPTEYLYLGIVLAFLLIIMHRENIKRLLAGKESKFDKK